MHNDPSGRIAVLRGPQRPALLRDERLSDILAATARRRPDHPALISGARTITYQQLDHASDRLGRALARRGAGPGRVVGLCLPRGADALIAQAGITKSGAAWLPFDAEAPVKRIATCLHLTAAVGLIARREDVATFAAASVPVWAIEDLASEPSFTATPVRPEMSDLAYVIFTSGSTGRPKGIGISQRSICHFLRSEGELLGVTDADRVYQGFSLAFDMSFEEIWISYLVGAALWIAPPEVVADPDGIARAVARERITVLHAVPTLAGLIEDPLPTVRVLNLGGEACPEALAQRLAIPGRRVFNTYGPTETTVSATAAELRRDAAVTIGTPLPNYGVVVVDEHRRPVRIGETGELGIFGPGLAAGYVGEPRRTADRFVKNPVAESADEARVYLTGDRARIDEDGAVRWLGRADNQVKIRGFRVELEEISSALNDQPGVGAATTIVRPLNPSGAATETASGELVGFVSAKAGATLSPDALTVALRARIPRYMVPAHIEIVTELPRLPSGKIDAQRLRAVPLNFVANDASPVAARNEDDLALCTALAALCPGRPLRPELDLFDDLGGHSLLVARLVSALRADTRYASLGVGDIYRERRLGAIARAMGRLRARRLDISVTERPARSRADRFVCGAAQAAVVPALVLCRMADWLAPFFTYHYFTGDEGDSIPQAIAYSLTAFVVTRLVVFGIAILGKRLAGPLRSGRYPLWGVTYFRWWLASRFAALPDVYLLSGTPWMSLYLRALGARIGRDVLIDTITVGAPELLSVEDEASVGTFVNIENARVEAGWLILGPVRIESGATVDSYTVLEDNTVVGRRAHLRPQSALAAGRRIPDGEIWDGSPARPSSLADEALPPRPPLSVARAWTFGLLSGLTAVAVSVLFFLPAFPAFMSIDWLDEHTLDVFASSLGPVPAFGAFVLLAIPASVLFVGVTMLVAAALTRILPRQKPGTTPVYGAAYLRKRCATLVVDASLDGLHGLYASVYTPLWLRCLGAQVGRHAEVSTVEGLVPELLTIGDDAFVGDGAIVGDEDTRGGWMVLKPTRLGHRTFIGNGAYVADGADIPDDVLLGVQSRVPPNADLAAGQTWIGSPPIRLPAREASTAFADELTFRPSRLRQSARGLVEGLRIVLPLAMIIAVGYVIVRSVLPFTERDEWGRAALALAVAGSLYGLVAFSVVVALKWTLVGRYRPRAAPMWTPFVWLSEAVTNVYESLAVPSGLDLLLGTPMLPWALRLLGAHIGRDVYLNTTDLTEFDCVSIGDESELNGWCGPQTHLFEDRVMKIGRIDIGSRVTIGARTTILYDTCISDDVRLGPLTLVGKGERLPHASRWEGTPAEPRER